MGDGAERDRDRAKLTVVLGVLHYILHYITLQYIIYMGQYDAGWEN